MECSSVTKPGIFIQQQQTSNQISIFGFILLTNHECTFGNHEAINILA